ncbi:MAG: ATP-dependent DNA helicase RecG [Candidatus Spechtbacteria bacterium]|nr:ATP-dependent DNA helicase RecG [Candidatus Spechtbacteria bacterium]
MNLATPIGQISRIGPIYAKRLQRMGIKEVKDLLFHFPHRYQDFSNIRAIRDVGLGEVVTILGKVLDIQNTRTPRKRMNITEAIVEDASGAIKAVWFNQPFLLQNLRPELHVVLSGKTSFANDSLFLSNPSYEVTRPEQELKHTGRIVPIYPETAGITSRWFRYVVKPLLPLAEKFPEYLPPEILQRQAIPRLSEALKHIHFPPTLEDAKLARKRIAFGELFLIQTVALKEKMKLRNTYAPEIHFDIELAKEFVTSLPFTLTDSQRASAWEILQDLEKPYPMNRLLEGDVGSGKTVVAAMAALQTIKANHQVAFMVPTEILAEQHFHNLTKLLDPWRVTVAILTHSAHRKTSQKVKYSAFKISKTRVAKETAEGKIDIIIGTHALIQDTVKFQNLGLIIIDEQHRFGVEQRAALCKTRTGNDEQKAIPHLLSMTATPIPRTLSLAIYGDLDLSLITHMPKGRKEIITKIIPPAGRSEAYQFIREQIQKGRQAFVICPLIEESEKLEAKAAIKEHETLQKKTFPDFKVALLHGKMKGKEKEKIMKEFQEKKADILVSTSVVEVGIDIENAAVMVIEGAERFGLAQLYQFRGRVGRGEHQSYCFLFTDSTAKTTRARLKALLTAKNSFELAEEDLKIRGPGDFIGSRQSDMPDLAMASLSDLEFVKAVRAEVEDVLSKDPELKTNPLLRAKYEAFRKEIHFE